MNHYRGLVLVAGITGLAVLGLPVPVAAEPVPAANPMTSGDEASLRSFWTRYDVPARTQSDLIAKVEAGRGVDALGGTPVSSKNLVSGDPTSTLDVFADGSIAVLAVGTVRQAWASVSLHATGGTSCHVTSSTSNSGSYRCTISMNIGVVNIAYKGNYTAFASAPSRISSVTSLEYGCIGVACSSAHLHVVRSLDKPSLSALAEARLTFGRAANSNEWLRFFVHDGVPSSKYN